MSCPWWLRLLVLWAPMARCVTCLSQEAVELPHPAITLLDALKTTLEQNPDLQLQVQQLESSKGVLRASAGAFDLSINAAYLQNHLTNPLTTAQAAQYALAGLIVDAQAQNNTTYTIETPKLFRNGVSIDPTATLTRTTDNISTRQGLNQSQVAFQINIPLLRGRGRDAVDAQEKSAGSTVQANVRDVNQEVALLLTTTAIQYWNAVAAAQNLEIAKDSETRGEKYLQDVQMLIDKDRVARGEINQLVANLANRKATSIAAEQQLATARQNLALAMGLSASQLVELPETLDNLPDWAIEGDPRVTPALTNRFVSSALKLRADVIAADFQVTAAKQLLPAAQNQLLPQLNASLSTGYNGIATGTPYGKPFGALFDNVRGANVTGSITYSFPPRNDTAAGQWTQARAAFQAAVLNRDRVTRTAASGVVTATTGLSFSVSALRQAREAVGYYRLALNNEVEKFHLGRNTLVNVTTMEDYLNSALLAEVSAHLGYAVALANLRFATGTVVDASAPVQSVDKTIFLQPPFEWGNE